MPGGFTGDTFRVSVLCLSATGSIVFSTGRTNGVASGGAGVPNNALFSARPANTCAGVSGGSALPSVIVSNSVVLVRGA